MIPAMSVLYFITKFDLEIIPLNTTQCESWDTCHWGSSAVPHD